MASVTSTIPGIGGGFITHTSQLINDGEFPEDNSKFVEEANLGDIIVGLGMADKNEVIEIDSHRLVWDSPHTLEKVCSVITENEHGDEIIGVIKINDGSRIQIHFNNPVKGRIILN